MRRFFGVFLALGALFTIAQAQDPSNWPDEVSALHYGVSEARKTLNHPQFCDFTDMKDACIKDRDTLKGEFDELLTQIAGAGEAALDGSDMAYTALLHDANVRSKALLAKFEFIGAKYLR